MSARKAFWRAAALTLFASALLAAPLAVSSARANLPLGACFFANGSCQDLDSLACEALGETFIGEGTSCSTIDCSAPLAVPMLSIFGLVAAIGALAALGARRLLMRRHPP